jgi:hypothetical protein
VKTEFGEEMGERHDVSFWNCKLIKMYGNITGKSGI